MKKSISRVVFFICIFLTLHAYSQLPAVVKDWAKFAGNQDSSFKAPIVSDDSGYTYVGTFTVNSLTGADILVVKYNENGDTIWTRTWTGGGNGRDQASGITVDEKNVYVCGITYASSTNNYDYVTLSLSKSTGVINWGSTYNGSASNFDIATAIAVNDSGVYVTGISNDSNTTLDYMTVKYSPLTGAEGWRRAYDYDSLDDIPFAIAVTYDTIIVVTGGSQRTLYDWDYAIISYTDHGTRRDTVRVTGSAAGFDRATAVKTDASGNIYITGTISQTTSGYDIKTVKINPNGTVAWQATYDNSNGTDEGVDLIVDASGNVYVCGKSYSSAHNFDYVVRKYNSSGTVQWTGRMDLTNGVDEPRKMCFDSYGNIVVTGKGYNSATESFDFFTVALSPSGDKVWRETYGVVDRGDDGAEDIAADNNGNIYVTGEVVLELGTNPQTVTIKYRTDYYTDPQQIDTPSVANYFYPNYGQIANIEGKGISEDDLHYYTVHHNPQLYFQAGKMNMVFSKIDQDTSTTDTLQRVDVSFLNSNNETKAIPINDEKDSTYFNYYLGHCPEGITNVVGEEKLIYTDIYGDIDAIFSSNNAGLKLYFVCKPYSDPGNIGLLFDGQDDLQIVNNWGLQVQTSIGNYEFEKPRVYEIDGSGNVTTLTWLLSWNIPQTGQAMFAGWGTYDHGKTLVIKIGRTMNTNSTFQGISYSTYCGGVGSDEINSVVNDHDVANGPSYFIYGAGFSSSPTFPLASGFNLSLPGPGNSPEDAFVFRMESSTGRLRWGTFYGGENGERATDLASYKDVGLFMCGSTYSDNLPQNQFPNYATITNGNVLAGGVDNFIVKLDYSSGHIFWANYIGSSADENYYKCAITIDYTGIPANAKIFVAGTTLGNDFPNFPYSGTNTYNQNANNGEDDGYILMFSSSGDLEWGTYFGSQDGDGITDIYVTPRTSTVPLRLYIAGTTRSSGYDQTTSCEPPPSTNGDFPNCNSVNGSIYQFQGAEDNFIAEFDENLALKWSTFIGGSGNETSWPHGLTGYDNVVYLGFNTDDDNGFPSPPVCSTCFSMSAGGNQDGYIARFDNETLSWSSFWGGHLDDVLYSIKTYGTDLFITGNSNYSPVTSSTNYCLSPPANEYPLCPGQPGCYFSSYYGLGSNDVFLATFNTFNELTWSILIGGNNYDVGLDLVNDRHYNFLVGKTSSHKITSTNEDYPQFFSSAPGAFNQNINAGGFEDGFITRFDNNLAIGIDEIDSKENEFTIFPNPTFNLLYIKSLELLSKKVYYSIENVLGKKIFQINC